MDRITKIVEQTINNIDLTPYYNYEKYQNKNNDTMSPESGNAINVSATLIDITSGEVIATQCWVTQSNEDRMLGFQFLKSMSKDMAIWFEFDEPETHSIHMRNVYFPLLILWLDENQYVIDKTIAQPDGRIYTSNKMSKFIAECDPSYDTLISLGHKLVLEDNSNGIT